MLVLGVEKATVELSALGVDRPHGDVVLAPGARVVPDFGADVALLNQIAVYTAELVVNVGRRLRHAVLPGEHVSKSHVTCEERRTCMWRTESS